MEIILMVLGLFIASYLLSTASNLRLRTDQKLRNLEQKLDLILGHLGIELPAVEAPADVERLLLEGKKIHAIKAYREKTGVGLAEAKAAVESIERQLNAQIASGGRPSLADPRYNPASEIDGQLKTQIKRGGGP